VLLAGALVLGATPTLRAQTIVRPWLDWKTTETEHFVFHYPERYAEWARTLLGRVEGIRDQVTPLIGFAPDRRVQIVIDDPASIPNGFAFTSLDAPTIVLWPSPPDPREEIGNALVWQELLLTHEYAHVAHLTRPSRNRLRRLLWSLSPVPLGPIASGAPRWVLEGYATYIEGRVTGSGRPNNAWRAALLRQFALEGRLPTYGQLNSSGGGWETGSFAYLAGSAYLEWLARREGDSSLVALWRRSTAVTNRSFDQAFAGIYGAAPAELYGRFIAELTGNALAVERAIGRDTTRAGVLLQRLVRNTGDPAVSPDGRHVALTIRRTDMPSQLVVWRTVDDPDTTLARRRDAQARRDPEDVPDRAFYPPPKKAVITLVATAGAPYESPRWFSDDKHLLVTRVTPSADGTQRSDLYIWSAEDGNLRRLTRGAGLRDADPSTDGRWAAAVRCDRGWCDLVRVDLSSGAWRVLRPGGIERNYYRPRVSRVTGEIIVAEQGNDRWRIARVNPETGALVYADPADGVSRYDATFARDGRTIITTSEAGGIANLERLDPTGTPVRLSAVTGAAVAPDVAPDGSIWFLSLHGKGYDLRRLSPDSVGSGASAPLATVLVDGLSPVLPPRTARTAGDSTRRPARMVVSDERPYGVGPTRIRYFPAATSGFGGSSAQLALVRSDPVGRLGIALLGSVGSAALPAGGSLALTWRRFRTELTADGWISHEAPSRVLPAASQFGLDLSRSGGAIRADRLRAGAGSEITGTLALVAEAQRPSHLPNVQRGGVIGAVAGAFRQNDEDMRYEERLSVNGEAGRTAGSAYLRQRSALQIGFGRATRALTTLDMSFGSVGGGEGGTAEQFVIGSVNSPLIDSLYDMRRVEAPAYPLGSGAGSRFVSLRAAVPFGPMELFYSGVSTDNFRTPLRSWGAEMNQRVPAIAAIGTPSVAAVAGIARAVDEPVKDAWRFYLTLSLRP
jgi:hypothetical protein